MEVILTHGYYVKVHFMPYTGRSVLRLPYAAFNIVYAINTRIVYCVLKLDQKLSLTFVDICRMPYGVLYLKWLEIDFLVATKARMILYMNQGVLCKNDGLLLLVSVYRLGLCNQYESIYQI